MSLFDSFTFDPEQITYYLDLISSNKKKTIFIFFKNVYFFILPTIGSR